MITIQDLVACRPRTHLHSSQALLRKNRAIGGGLRKIRTWGACALSDANRCVCAHSAIHRQVKSEQHQPSTAPSLTLSRSFSLHQIVLLLRSNLSLLTCPFCTDQLCSVCLSARSPSSSSISISLGSKLREDCRPFALALSLSHCMAFARQKKAAV